MQIAPDRDNRLEFFNAYQIGSDRSRSLENLIFSLDSLQSWAVRASKKKYVSVVSREIAYRSQTGKPPAARVSQPVRSVARFPLRFET